MKHISNTHVVYDVGVGAFVYAPTAGTLCQSTRSYDGLGNAVSIRTIPVVDWHPFVSVAGRSGKRGVGHVAEGDSHFSTSPDALARGRMEKLKR